MLTKSHSGPQFWKSLGLLLFLKLEFSASSVCHALSDAETTFCHARPDGRYRSEVV